VPGDTAASGSFSFTPMLSESAFASSDPPGVLTSSAVAFAALYTTAASSRVTVSVAEPVEFLNDVFVLETTASMVRDPAADVTCAFGSVALASLPNVTGLPTFAPPILNWTVPWNRRPTTA
jgi:hypothetical protein